MSGVDAVVVAAGASARMGGVDKLFAPICGRPLLAWTLAALADPALARRIVVVVAADRVAEVATAAWLPAAVSAVVAGGARRQDSVAAGVAALGEGQSDDVILVHDGARPLVTGGLVARVAAAAEARGAAIPVVPVAETLKRIVDGRVEATVDRATLAAAQTPQGVRRDVLARAWTLEPPDGPSTWTDEAALLEACRIPVHVVPGEPMNLKVTLPDDLARVEAALAARGDVALGGPSIRIGYGDDGHAFGPGGPLVLGGLSIDGAPRLHGHSDGDVVLHAVCDAMLGAAGLGDLGRAFPAGPATPAGIAGMELLVACLGRVRAAGYVPVSLDLTIIGARPRLAGRLEEMAASVAGLLGLVPDRVNVKASTGEPCRLRRAGRGIAARAVAVLAPAGTPGAAGHRPLAADGHPWRAAREPPVTIRLQDTLSGELRELEPLEPGHVRVYSCGPTVYGPAHVGNFRSFLFADLLVRHLRWRGLRVTWVMNLTDVDDKIIRGATAEGIGIDELADRWIARFLEDARTLRLTRPDVLPRATEHIPEMVSLVERLVAAGHAYRTDDGSIFFRIASWPAYGRLARLDPAQLRVGERVATDEYSKDDVRDFVLWKGPRTGERAGRPPSAPGAPAGTSNARRCRCATSASRSTSIRAASTWSSLTTRTRSPSPRPRPAGPSSGPGSTAPTSRWAVGRWRSRRATSPG